MQLKTYSRWHVVVECVCFHKLIFVCVLIGPDRRSDGVGSASRVVLQWATCLMPVQRNMSNNLTSPFTNDPVISIPNCGYESAMTGMAGQQIKHLVLIIMSYLWRHWWVKIRIDLLNFGNGRCQCSCQTAIPDCKPWFRILFCRPPNWSDRLAVAALQNKLIDLSDKRIVIYIISRHVIDNNKKITC